MTTIEQSLEIPEDRHLRLDVLLPEGFPPGQAKVLIYISPDVESEPLVPLSELAGCLKDSPIFAGDPMEVQRKIRSDVW
ncbi:MAG: hypothetical protein LBQ79_04875 [Deltaproteobacteria bacterium]|jgi:hypothetical protein|nr:hypothetical protein [Deltaproteobacteria bacterium]